MQPDKSIHIACSLRVLRATLWFLAGGLLFLALIPALTVTLAWWRNELPVAGAAEWFWMAMLPVLVWIHLRFFSVFRPDCHACLANDRSTPSAARGP